MRYELKETETNYWGFEQVFKVMQYPAGESHVEALWIPQDPIVIIAHARNFTDLGNIVTANTILNRNHSRVKWFIPYFPFARHDRRRNHMDGIELTIALKMVEGLDVVVLDPHSDVLGAALPYVPQSTVVALWRQQAGFDNLRRPVYVIPDQGATKKAMTWLRDQDEYVQASKVRNVLNGALSRVAIEPNGRSQLTEADVIIVDDICDGGGTFLLLAEALADYYPNSLTLCVSHGLFTKGLDKIKEKFDYVRTVGLDVVGLNTIPYDHVLNMGGII